MGNECTTPICDLIKRVETRNVARKSSVTEKDKQDFTKIAKIMSKLMTQPGKKVIYIFGGPGTRKGRVTEDLSRLYDFQVICTERLIIKHLPTFLEKLGTTLENEIQDIQANSKKVPSTSTDDDTFDADELLDLITDSNKVLKKVLEAHPELVNLDWLLQVISQEITKSPAKVFLVDLIPNFQFLQKSSAFLEKDCFRVMENAEKLIPNLFAVLLTIPVENIKAPGATPRPKEVKKEQKKEDGPSSEQDLSHLKQRYMTYMACVEKFLGYFEGENKLVTVDVSSGTYELIWNRINQIFSELNFMSVSSAYTVLLFVNDEGDLTSLMKTFTGEKMSLKELTTGVKRPLEIYLKKIVRCVLSKPAAECYLVDCTSTDLLTGDQSQLEEGTKNVTFVGLEMTSLDKYISAGENKNKRGPNIPLPASYQAVCSTENLSCMFPQSVSLDRCQEITIITDRMLLEGRLAKSLQSIKI